MDAVDARDVVALIDFDAVVKTWPRSRRMSSRPELRQWMPLFTLHRKTLSKSMPPRQSSTRKTKS